MLRAVLLKNAKTMGKMTSKGGGNKSLKYPTGGIKNQTSKGVGGRSNPNHASLFDVSPTKQYGGQKSKNPVISSKLELKSFPVKRGK